LSYSGMTTFQSKKRKGGGRWLGSYLAPAPSTNRQERCRLLCAKGLVVP